MMQNWTVLCEHMVINHQHISISELKFHFNSLRVLLIFIIIVPKITNFNTFPMKPEDSFKIISEKVFVDETRPNRVHMDPLTLEGEPTVEDELLFKFVLGYPYTFDKREAHQANLHRATN